MLQQGFVAHLPFEFVDLDFNRVERIEFVFKLKNTPRAEAFKTAVWYPGQDSDLVFRSSEDENVLVVSWTREETYIVPIGSTFYFQPRIHFKDSLVEPQTPIIPIIMHGSLFAEGEEYV